MSGEDETEQLACIMEVCGLPPDYLLASAKRRKLFFDSVGNPRAIANSQDRVHEPGRFGLGVLCGTWAVLRKFLMSHWFVLSKVLKLPRVCGMQGSLPTLGLCYLRSPTSHWFVKLACVKPASPSERGLCLEHSGANAFCCGICAGIHTLLEGLPTPKSSS